MPFADPIAIFNLVGHSIVGSPFPATQVIQIVSHQAMITNSCLSIYCDNCRKKLTMKMILKGLIRNKVIYQHPLRASNAISNKRHEVTMVNATDDIDLCLEFPLTLSASGLELLHCNLFAIWQNALVHIAKPTLPQQIGLRETTSCHRKLLIGEGALDKPQGNVWGWRWQWWPMGT